MPFKSERQCRLMPAKHPKMAECGEPHIPPGKFPSKVKKAYAEGVTEALELFGLKTAAGEIRLKIPKREFHGIESAFKPKNGKPLKMANTEPHEPQADSGQPAEMLAEALRALPFPKTPMQTSGMADELSSFVSWGGPVDISEGAV